MMPKVKTKEVAFGVRATEVKPGMWEFAVDGDRWVYDSLARGLNVAQLRPDGSPAWCVYTKTINEAVCFAQGWTAGLTSGRAPSPGDNSSRVGRNPGDAPPAEGGGR